MNETTTQPVQYSEETLKLLFPEPLNEDAYLMAHGFYELERGGYGHASMGPGDKPLTKSEAVESCRGVDKAFLDTINRVSEGPVKGMLWRYAAYYQYLIEPFEGDARFKTMTEQYVMEWAKDKLPA